MKTERKRKVTSWKKQALQNEDEAERRKKKMKERDQLRNWDPAWGSQLRDLG